MARGGPPPIKFYTPRQLRQQTNQQVRQTIRAQQAPIVSAQKLADQRATAARAAMQGFGLAGAAILKGAAPQAGDAYRQAAAEESGMANAFAGSTAQAMQQDVANRQALIDRLAPGGQMVGQPNPQAVQNSMYLAHGFDPGASNEALAANAINLASDQPGIQVGRTQEQMQGSIVQQAQDDQQYTKQMLDLAATVPQLRTQIMQQLQANEMAKRSAWIQQQAQNSLTGYRNAQVRQSNARIQQGNARIALQAANLRLSQAKDRQAVRQQLRTGKRIDSAASHAAGYLIDRNGDPMLNGKGQRIPVYSSSGGGAGAGSKTGPGSTSWKEAYRYAQSTYIQPMITGTNTPDPTWKATPYPRMIRYLRGSYGLTRGQAVRLLRGMGIKRTTKRG